MPQTPEKNPKILLLDLARELDGETLESTFKLFGHEWTISLLTEDESNWRNGFVNTGSRLSTITSWRLPTLAIGIRAIDGIPVFEFFRQEWEASEEGRQIVTMLDGKGRFSRKYFAAEYMMEFLSDRRPDILEKMWDFWQELEDRREAAQDAVKKSSGEDSEKATSESGTESSPSGDE